MTDKSTISKRSMDAYFMFLIARHFQLWVIGLFVKEKIKTLAELRLRDRKELY